MPLSSTDFGTLVPSDRYEDKDRHSVLSGEHGLVTYLDRKVVARMLYYKGACSVFTGSQIKKRGDKQECSEYISKDTVTMQGSEKVVQKCP